MEEADNVKGGIEKAINLAKKRRFIQTVDMIINFKNIDFSKQDNRLKLDISLPNSSKQKKVALIAREELASEGKGVVDRVITPDDLEKLGKDKKEVKKLANSYDVFIAEATLMPLVGRYLGQVLAPRGKMPTPIPPNVPSLEPIIKKMKSTIHIRSKGKYMPVVHVPIGNEDMEVGKIVENAEAVLHAIVDKLPQGGNNIKDVMFKLTMGPPVRVKKL